MKKLLSSMSVLLLTASPALAVEGDLNKMAHIAALTHTERAPRPKKWFWTKPGKIIFWHYDWVLEDGTHRTQVLDHPLGNHIPDERPWVERQPNMSRLLPAGMNGAFNALGNYAGNKL